MKTVWIYVDTSKQAGDKDHLKVFASIEAAHKWFEEHDPEGVAFEYHVLGSLAHVQRALPLSDHAAAP